jgi:hypothetical protein
MNRRTDARQKHAIRKNRPGQFAANVQMRFRIPLENFYSRERKKRLAERKSIPRFQFGAVIEDFIPFQRNIRNRQSVYTGAAGYRAVPGEIQKKTPRWQPRGHDTQSFRPLVQEE